ncbi:disintegrin and metalloproteinase domain-containing protein 15 isoform X2 [Microcaecilia unicolor]|uniref:Disintegrin and metalloproteinase domain-containing protein 15 isoform X2 n=1 Tax=Microcaecilia unicolor TaxID=1415580 RepID=A0A6P7WYJ1_9AMPH|nr:disintegrin and metalloproteinase domain-containing protein 15 isoform X2 [Microcaecilia unicolor]
MERTCGLLVLCWLCWARGEDGAHRGSRWSEDPTQRADGGPKRDQPTKSQEVLVYVVGEHGSLSLEEALKEGPPSHLQVLLETEGGRLFLELQQNEVLLSGAHTLVFYLPNGTQVTEDGTEQVNCYYRGHVKGYPGSWISVSVCCGLRGHLAVSGDRSYDVQPVSGPGDPRHLFFKIQDIPFPDVKCGMAHPSQWMPSGEERPHLHRGKRDLMSEVKYIELVIVTDKKEYEYYHGDTKRLQIRMLEIANQVDVFYRPLNVRVAVVAVEIWNEMDQITVDQNPSVTLNRFLAWRETKLLPRIKHDNAQLVIGGQFEGSAVGMASQTSMCSPERSGGVNVDHSVSTLGVASTMAHELGHNLGMNHDTTDRKCNCSNLLQVKSCIMEPATGFLPGLGFSSCSRSDLETSLRQGGGMCLFNVPEAQRIFGAQRCGNLFVEVGEECDCGLAEVCKDPCCNATTCKLVPGAKCSSDGICCENCQLKRSGSLCREPLGECDLPEYCDGVSSFCPPNVFLQDGHPCKSSQAFCYSGDCRTYDSQCQVLWGPGSTQAPDDCFRFVNMRGDKYGNCGRSLNGTYVPCRARDMKCGKIQCQGGNERPLLGSNAEVVNHRERACRSVHFNLGDDITDPAMVMSGTACGSGKVCINQKCQNVSTLGVQECQRKCSGHGVCNSNKNCHCDRGWSSPDCKGSGYGGSVDSGPLEPETDSSAVSTGLLLVFLLLLPLVVLLGICYFKRSTLRKGLCRFRKASSCQYSAEPETRVQFLGEGVTAEGNRISHTEARTMTQVPPERPRPPQRMQSTELQVMPAITKPFSQDSARPDPPSKPLPPDPVPKQSQGTAFDRPAPPSRPLPEDPVPRKSQPQVPVKPPPPKKPLPSDPPTEEREELLSAVPIYTPQAVVFPSRPAPPPPPATATGGNLQAQQV